MFIYLSVLHAWLDNHSYRFKLAGNEELYLAMVQDKIRMVSAKNINKTGVISEAVILEKDNYVEIEFCNRLLSAKSTDPGVIPVKDRSNLTRWELIEVDNGYQLENNGKCLSFVDGYDDKTRGYYLNTRNCNEGLKNVFVGLNAGLSANFCSKEAEILCKKMGYRGGQRKNRGDSGYDTYDDSSDLDRRHKRAVDDKNEIFDRPKNRSGNRSRDSDRPDRLDRPDDGDDYSGRRKRHPSHNDPDFSHHGRVSEHTYHHPECNRD